MSGFLLDDRMRLSIEVALAAASGDTRRLCRAEDAAMAAGMTGAEIDAFRRGESFDFQLSRAIGLALAPDQELLRRARRAGLSDRVCMDIAALAAASREVRS
jgi:hypothetical protein